MPPQPGQPPQGQPQQQQAPAPPPLPQQRPKNIPVNSGVETHQPDDATLRFDSGAKKKLSDPDWTALSNDLFNSIVTADYGARGPLNKNLKEWSDAYDMIQYELDTPFENSSNLQLPYLTSQVNSLVAYIAGTVLQPSLMLVTGNTGPAQQMAARVEKFYNAEITRLRADGSSYQSHFIDLLRLGLRDGVGIMEVLWARDRRRLVTVTNVPVVDELTGNWKLDDNGDPMFEEKRDEADVYVKDYAQVTNIPLKEFILIPAEARSIEDAAAVVRTEWLYEDELDRRVRAGFFDGDEVEQALNWVPTGMSDVAADPAGTYDKSASYQLGIGMAQGSLTSKFFKNRGPIKVRRFHSRQYDMNGDGIPEENIFWLHEYSQRMLGWIPYDYADGKRPFFAFKPFPRADQFLGFSVPEMEAGVQTELDTIHNERRNAITARMEAPLAVEEGSTLLNRKGEFGMQKVIEVERVGQNASFQQLTMPDVPLADFQQEALVKSYGDELTGLGAPSMGQQSSGKRSATEMRQRNAAQGTRLDLNCKEFRTSLIQVMNFVHALNKQYLRTPPATMVGSEKLTLPLESLMLDYTISVSGATDPIDSITRRNENMTFVELVTKLFPWIAQDPVKSWHLAQILFDVFNRADAQLITGTEDEARQRAEQQAKQAQMQQQLAMQDAQAKAQMGQLQHGQGQQQSKPPGR